MSEESIFNLIEKGDPNPIESLVQSFPQVLESRNSAGLTPIMVAIDLGSEDVITAIVDGDCGLLLKDDMGRTPVMLAASKLDSHLLKQIVEASARQEDSRQKLSLLNYSGQGSAGKTKRDSSTETSPKRFMPRGSSLSDASGLKESGSGSPVVGNGRSSARVSPRGSKLRGSMTRSVSSLEIAAAVTREIVNTKDYDGLTAMTHAARAGLAANIKYLSAVGASPNLTDIGGWSPLMYAVRHSKEDAAKCLVNELNVSADVGVDQTGYTALMKAAALGDVSMLRFLIARGARVTRTDNIFGQSALMWACATGHLEVVKELVSSGAPVNEKAKNGKSPLLFAVTYGHLDIAEFLLSAGATATSEDANGENAVVLSARNNCLSGVQFATSKLQLSASSMGRTGASGLLVSVEQGFSAITEHLVKEGADVHMKDESGRTPLSVASKQSDKQMVVLLKRSSTYHRT